MKQICAVLVGLLAFTQALADSRQVRFSTDEGTWISLDVAPDASSIVFELVGDLYVMPVGGGHARRLTDGPAFDAQPRYSPDGRSILFVSDRSGAENLWTLDVETSATRALTRETGAFFISPEWTPDGKQIVVSKSTKDVSHGRHYQLFVYSADGSAAARQLTGADSRQPPGSLAVLGAAFGNDSQRLFAAFQVKPKWPSTATWQIGTVDVASGVVKQLTEELNSAVRPIVSPDGRHLIYATEWEGRTHLKLLELASRKSRWLVSDIDRSARETAPRRDLLPSAAFTPDGDALIYSNHGRLWRVALADGAIRPVPFTADVDVQLAPLAHFEYSIDERHVDARRIEQPQLSPDGKMLAFSALGRIWMQDMRSRSRPRQVSDEGDTAFFPTWSPDGRWLAYVTWNDLQGGGISRVDVQGRRPPERLPVANDFYEKLAYSPDGRRFVAARSLFNERFSFYNENLGIGRGNSRELVWLPAEGGAATVITHINPVTYWGASSHYGRPHFSQDTTRLYFTDPVDGLVRVAWDGSQREAVLRIEGPGFAKQEIATEMMLSPDGTRVLSMVNNQAWLVDLPVRAQSEPKLKLPIVVLPADSPALPSRRLSRQGADFPQWSADGRTVTWSLGSTFFIRDIATSRDERHDVLVRVPRDVPKGSIVLRGARAITMRGDEIIQPADIVVTDDRIVAVGAQGTLRVPKDARIFDVTGKTILPGYVDVHWHGAAPWGVHRTQVWEFQANLAYGVTGIRDPQPASMDALTYGDRIASGEVLGPRYFTTGRGIFVNDGIRSPEDARDIAERHAKFYRTETLKDYMTNADRQVHQWLMAGVREYKLTPTAEGNSDFKWSLTRVFDGFSGQEHMTTATPFYRDLALLFANSGITITPTVLEGQPGGQDRLERFVHEHGLHRDAKVRHFFPTAEIEALEVAARKGPLQSTYTSAELMAQPLAVLAAGGKIALGVHGAIQGLGAHWALWTYVDGGMRPHDALRAATIVGAEAIGHGKNFGSIEAGKLADLQVLEGDPLQDIRQSLSLRYVMINGRLYQTDELDQVWPQANQLSPQWWQQEPRVRTQ
ncbi:amidohydrolase family protein [Steroidobacter flavus]|uniref:Amidohydrolase family protein n=1 Tax=Steroidobacter flavus TaxID=1842136 RepID=A0ABV8T289_9GAMM